ncbi:hypothetical protein ACX8XP_12325 [Calditrichota bacterium LG25]
MKMFLAGQWPKPLKRFPLKSCPNDQPAVKTAGYNHLIPAGF